MYGHVSSSRDKVLHIEHLTTIKDNHYYQAFECDFMFFSSQTESIPKTARNKIGSSLVKTVSSIAILRERYMLKRSRAFHQKANLANPSPSNF